MIEQPTVHTYMPGTAHEAVEHRHPAFGCISAGRITGTKALFNSDFTHSGYVRIRIATSVLRRSYSEDQPSPAHRNFVELDLSESQWASFVSSLNIGQGTPCTIVSRDGERVPDLPPPVSRVDQYAADSAKRMERAKEAIAEAQRMLEASGLSKAKVKEISSHLLHASYDIGSNQAFVARQFGEHMEKTVNAAKVEIGAYINSAVRQVGLDRLQAGSGVAPFTLEMSSTKTPSENQE